VPKLPQTLGSRLKYCPFCGVDSAIDKDNRSSSLGAKYLPEAFSDYIYRHGSALCEAPQFYRGFVEYVLNASKDLEQLIIYKATLVHMAKVLVGKTFEGSEEHLLWCAISLCSDKYYEEKGRLYNWQTAQEEMIKEIWYKLISRVFIPNDSDGRLNMPAMRQWQEHFTLMQKEESGPMSACKPCQLKCQYRYEGQVLAGDATHAQDFNSAVNSTTTPVSEAAAWYARLLSERYLRGGNLDLAYCFSLHLLQNLETPAPDQHKLSSDAQLILAHKIRESLEETDRKASELKAAELPIGSIRQQVFEVVVRQALKGAPWRELCAGPMLVNQITPEEIEAEVKKRR
jgi:hypothetical protein